jgi:hypothetical protein
MARYKDAIEWIARNDNPGDYETAEEISRYLTVGLVADLWGKSESDVAVDVERVRLKDAEWRVHLRLIHGSTNDRSG